MIGTSSDSNGQVADLVFVVEGTANMGAYLGELRANYIVPTLEYFNGGSSKEEKDYGSELNSTMYALVVFMAADIAPESAVSCVASPTTCINKFLGWLDRVPFLGGAAEGCSHISEGLGAALQAFDDFQTLREPHLTTQKHCILICNSPPYPLPCLESVNYAGMMCEQLAAMMGERNINLSVISPRKIPALLKIYDKSSGDLQMAQNKNYTKDRRHLVLLKGYHLQERPLSPTSVDVKEKLPIPTNTLPIDTKPILPPSNLMPVGSPGSNNLIPKGKKRTASPPNQPPFKMANPGTISGVGSMGIGMNTMQSQGPQLVNSQATPMSTATSNPPQMSYIQIAAPSQMNMGPGVRQIGPTGMPMNRLAPPQTSPSFMNQPNPPNVTITKGPPLPVITSQPMDTTAMGRPIRDPNPNSQGQRMVWNPPGRPQMSSGQTGNAANPMPGVGINNPGMSSLVARLNQPTRGNGGIMTGPRPPGPDMMNSMPRPPSVNTVNSATMNTPGQANLVGMLQQGNIGPGGPNHLHQNPAIQTNMMHGPQKNMNNQMNMNTLGSAANIPNQVGGQQPSNQIQQMGNNSSIMTSQQSTGVQMGNQPAQIMQSTGQLPGQQNVIGGQIPQSIPGPISQMNNMGAAPGQGPMIQGQVLNQTMLNQANNQQPSMQQQQPQQRKEKQIIWQGIIEWQEKPKMPNDPNGKVNRQVPCQVSSTVNSMGEPEVNAEKWPSKLIMQLIPKVLMHQFGNTFLKMSRNVIFYFGKSMETAEALASLNKVMSTGFVGCVHFSSQQNMNCDIRILMLVYGNDMHSYIGFIPNDQTGFVATIRNVITKKQQNAKQQQQGGVMPQQQQQQMFGVQPGQSNQPINPGMNLPIAGPAVGAPGGLGGPGNVLPSSLNQNQATTGPPPNLLPSTVTGPSGGIPIGQNGPAVAGRNSPNPQMQAPGSNSSAPVPDHIVNERQQNLLKIEQLRQSLIAAQQKEVQFKAAQEQQQHHVPPTLRQSDLLLLQQLQQQQQQQPRLLANNASNANNPQLRQLLQISQQLQMMQNQQGIGGPRSGVPEMGQGPGSGQSQPPNTGSSMFPDDIFCLKMAEIDLEVGE